MLIEEWLKNKRKRLISIDPQVKKEGEKEDDEGYRDNIMSSFLRNFNDH